MHPPAHHRGRRAGRKCDRSPQGPARQACASHPTIRDARFPRSNRPDAVERERDGWPRSVGLSCRSSRQNRYRRRQNRAHATGAAPARKARCSGARKQPEGPSLSSSNLSNDKNLCSKRPTPCRPDPFRLKKPETARPLRRLKTSCQPKAGEILAELVRECFDRQLMVFPLRQTGNGQRANAARPFTTIGKLPPWAA